MSSTPCPGQSGAIEESFSWRLTSASSGAGHLAQSENWNWNLTQNLSWNWKAELLVRVHFGILTKDLHLKLKEEFNQEQSLAHPVT